MSKALTATQIAAAFKGKLASSGLSVRDGTKLGIEPMDAGVTMRKGYKPFAAIRIPYFDWSGKQVDFERIRYLEDTRTGFDRLTKSKERRYDQLAGTGIEVYLPPLMKDAWGLVLRDPKVDLVITEGEFKAACATSNGVPCIGLGGVWNFVNGEDKTELLPQLELAAWEERNVIIAFDSDAVNNIQVVKAENRLARYLLDRGAKVYILRLPSVYSEESGKKTGLDDFIIEQGVDELKRQLQEEVTEFAPSKAFHELNEEVVFVRSEKTIVETNSMLRMNLTDFTSLVYAPRTYMGFNADGDEVPKPLAAAWVKWPYRRTLTATTYVPGGDLEVSNKLNTWAGWGCEPIEGPIDEWIDLRDFLFSTEEDPKPKQWFEQWLACPIQRPGTKMHSACMLVGPQGTGKTLIFDTYAKIYGDNAITITPKHFNSDHNTWAERKQFVIGNEILSDESRREASDTMKELITRDKVNINPKFINEYSLPDCINYGLTSNHPNALMMEEDDRRYFVHRVPKVKQTDEFYQRVKRFKDGTGPSHLFYYLLHYVDLDDFNPDAAPPWTSAKFEMQSHSRSMLSDWVVTLKHDPDQITRLGSGPAIQHSLFSIEELFNFFVVNKLDGMPGKYTQQILARELRASGVVPASNNMGVRTKEGQKRLWIVRNAEELEDAPGARIAAVYDAERLDSAPPKRRKF